MFLPSIEGKKVLEIGCGYGYNAYLFANKAKEVTGVDTDGRAISRAKEHYGGVENLTFCQDDALRYVDGTNEKFDTVVLFEIIEHVGHQEQAALVAGLRRILKSPGELLLSTPNGRFCPFYRRNPYHQKELSVGELRELLSQNGFDIRDMRGQIPVAWLYVPLPWALLERFFAAARIHERIHRIRPRAESSRTILVRAVKSETT